MGNFDHVPSHLQSISRLLALKNRNSLAQWNRKLLPYRTDLASWHACLQVFKSLGLIPHIGLRSCSITDFSQPMSLAACAPSIGIENTRSNLYIRSLISLGSLSNSGQRQSVPCGSGIAFSTAGLVPACCTSCRQQESFVSR